MDSLLDVLDDEWRSQFVSKPATPAGGWEIPDPDNDGAVWELAGKVFTAISGGALAQYDSLTQSQWINTARVFVRILRGESVPPEPRCPTCGEAGREISLLGTAGYTFSNGHIWARSA